MKLPRVTEFIYKGVRRVVIEKGPDARGCGLFTTQLVPVVGPRTFKPAEMMDCRKVGTLRSLWYLAKSFRVSVG